MIAWYWLVIGIVLAGVIGLFVGASLASFAYADREHKRLIEEYERKLREAKARLN